MLYERNWLIAGLNANLLCIDTTLDKAVSLTPSIVVAMSTIFQLLVYF